MSQFVKTLALTATALMFVALVGCCNSGHCPKEDKACDKCAMKAECPDCKAAGKMCPKCAAEAKKECADCKAAGKMCPKCAAEAAEKK